MRPTIRTRFGRRSIATDVDDELAFHLDMRTRHLIDAGLDPARARAEAHRRFGDLGEVRDSCMTLDEGRIRTMNRVSFLQDFRQDLTWAARVFRRTPMVSGVVIATLALGIGANTAIFGLVNAVLLRELPVRAPDELVIAGDPTRTSSMGFDSNPRGDLFNFTTYRQLDATAVGLSGLAATGRTERLDLRIDGVNRDQAPPRGRMVSANYFQVLGVGAFLGRTFIPGDEDMVGGAPVLTISHGYWLRRFGGDSSVIGRDVLLNDAKFTIIGVTPPGFRGEIVGQEIELWVPLAMQGVLWPNTPVLDDTQAYWLLLLGRRLPGASLEQVRSALAEGVRGLLTTQAATPAQAAQVRDLTVEVSAGARGLSRVRSTYRAPLLILMAGVALLLLIICANVANILLARAVARTREMSVRLAIGAGRGRLIRQLLTESFLLSLLGAGAGLVVSRWMSRMLLVMAAGGGSELPLDTTIGLPALAFTMVLSLTAVVVFGVTPALRASRVVVATAMRASGKALTGAGSGMGQRNPLGRLLIAGQVALSLILVVGATLLVRSLQHLQQGDTGLAREQLVIVDVDATARGYTETRLTALAVSLRARLLGMPGVTGASFTENGIFTGTESISNLAVPGFEMRERTDSLSYYDQVGPAFVAATGARLRRGRDFNEQDAEGTSPVVLLNESFARHYFKDQSPIGTTIRLGDSASAEVVGVVADVKDHSLTGSARKRFYVSYLQHPLGYAGLLRLVIRTSGDPALLIQPIRAAIAAENADLPIRSVDPLARLMRQSIAEERLLANLAIVFAGTALLLAAIGLYGVMSYAVSRRSGEIGLRVALGAQRATLVAMVLRDALVLVAIGITVGVPLTLGASRIIRNQLHGVAPTDPVAFGVALAVLALGALLAALVPAIRASRVAPVVALRAE